MPTYRSEAMGPLVSLLVVVGFSVLQPAFSQSLCQTEMSACSGDTTCLDCSYYGYLLEPGYVEKTQECVVNLCEVLLGVSDCNVAYTSYDPFAEPFDPDDVCLASSVTPCCIAELQTDLDCLGNTAFVEFWGCMANYDLESNRLEGECPTLTCSDGLNVPVDTDDDGGDDGAVSVDTDDDGGEDGGSEGEADPGAENSSPSGEDSDGAGICFPSAAVTLVVGLAGLAIAPYF